MILTISVWIIGALMLSLVIAWPVIPLVERHLERRRQNAMRLRLNGFKQVHKPI